ncbi:hypothetical protein HK096_011463, partial [Nowakowskiella sp. JEL0078]
MSDLSDRTVIEKLRIALGLVETLKQENEVYKENFDQLRDSYDQLKENFEDISKKLYISTKENVTIENHLKETVSQWKLQYDTKMHEVEDLKLRE